MKNLIFYNDDCFEMHKLAVRQKRTSDVKNRLAIIEKNIELNYQKYRNHFTQNNLELINPNTLYQPYKEDLLSLYTYKNKVIRTFREKLTKLQIKTITNTCQNCTINSINTLDHVLPKAIFPEYIVNPYNLFPCCSECNSYKEEKGSLNTKEYLNLYLDILPNQKYLFVEIILESDNELNFSFSINNSSCINVEIFDLIYKHYTNLHLLKRMKLKSIEYLTEYINEMKPFTQKMSNEEIRDCQLESIQKNKEAYGYNHWKYVLQEGLVNSRYFYNKIRES